MPIGASKAARISARSSSRSLEFRCSPRQLRHSSHRARLRVGEQGCERLRVKASSAHVNAAGDEYRADASDGSPCDVGFDAIADGDEVTAESLIREHGEDASHNLGNLLSSALNASANSPAMTALNP